MPAFSYTDQIWLKSPTVVKTVFDVKVHAVLRNLYDNQIWIDAEDVIWQKAHLASERKSLLEQSVVYNYAKDNRVGIYIEKFEQVNARKKITFSFSSEDKKNQAFAQWGINQNIIERWIEERIILEKFLQTHPPFQAIMTDRKIKQYYQDHKQDKFLDKAFEKIKDIVVQDYKKTHVKEEFKKWLAQEMRRQKWVVYE